MQLSCCPIVLSFQNNKTSEATWLLRLQVAPLQLLKRTGKTTHRGTKDNRKFSFCELRNRPRWHCPARKDVCHKCQKKRHWTAVCRGHFSATTHSEPSIVASVLLAAGSQDQCFYVLVEIGKHKLLGLVDSGASDSFITKAVLEKCKIAVTNHRCTTRLTDKTQLVILGSVEV